MRRQGLALGLVAALLLGGFLIAELLSGEASPRADAAPALPSTVLQGPAIDLADLRGQYVVVHFWASWCEPCVKEAPQLVALSRSLPGRATLVGVNWADNSKGARAFLRRHGWRFPVLEDRDGAVGEAYGISGLPVTYLIDTEGKVAETIVGPIREQQILADLQRLKRLASHGSPHSPKS